MIAFVQSAQNGVFSPASSLSKAFTSPNVAGNFLICAVRVYTGGGGTTTNVTDTNGNTWVKAPGSFVNAGLANVELWYAENCAGGSNTVTLSLPSPFYPKFVIAEYSGVATSSSYETQNHASGSGTAANSGNITTSNAFDLIVGFCENDTNGSLGVTPGAGWTQRELVDGMSVCDQIVSSTGTYAFSATIAGSVSWGAYILAFQAATAPAPGTGGVVCIMQ